MALTDLGGGDVRLELISPLPPMEVESYLLVDQVLLAMDETLAPLREINGSPRDHWRTFRNRARQRGEIDPQRANVGPPKKNGIQVGDVEPSPDT